MIMSPVLIAVVLLAAVAHKQHSVLQQHRLAGCLPGYAYGYDLHSCRQHSLLPRLMVTCVTTECCMLGFLKRLGSNQRFAIMPHAVQ